MGILITIIGAIMAVFIVIVLHEAGHFFVAKAFGVKVLRFSIGFGKTIWSHQSRSGTEYVLALLPLGGYVRMLDDREMHVSRQDSQSAFNRQSLFIRMAIVLAGPLTNIILAVVVFWIIFLSGISYIKPVIGKVTPQSIAERSGLKSGEVITQINDQPIENWQAVLTVLVKHIGDSDHLTITTQPINGGASQVHQLSLRAWRIVGNRPDPLASLGISPFQPNFPAIIEKVLPKSPAARGGLLKNDQIIKLNNQPVVDWPTLSEYIHHHPNQEIHLTVQQGNEIRELNVQLDNKTNRGQTIGFIGLAVKIPSWPKEMIETPHYSIMTALTAASQETWDLIAFNWTVLGKMFQGKISLGSLGGPITIFQSAGEASQAGLQAYLSFIGFISVTLGFLNILPVPGLDGGHFLFQVIECIIRRPIPERYQLLLLKLGIVLIVLLVVQGTFNDLMRLFR